MTRNTMPATARRAREATTLDRLHQGMDRNTERLLAMAIKSAVEERVQQERYVLPPEMAALLGPKATALPDTIVLLYLREVPAFAVAQLRDHLAQRVPDPDRQLKLMGLWNLDAARPVPRPRVFPRSVLVADLRYQDLMGRTTANRTLQLLAELGLTIEAQSGPNSTDVQVTTSLLELVENAVLGLDSSTARGHRLGLGNVSVPAAMTQVLRSFFLAGALGLATLASAPVWAHVPDQRTMTPQATTLSQFELSDRAKQLEADTLGASEIQFASLSQVLRDSRRLSGQQPQPAPIETEN